MIRLKTLAIIVATVAFVGCTKPAEQSVRQGEFVIDTLFTKDDCTVYRFSDAGHYRYFTNCSGSTYWSQSNGKTSYPTGIPGGRQ